MGPFRKPDLDIQPFWLDRSNIHQCGSPQWQSYLMSNEEHLIRNAQDILALVDSHDPNRNGCIARKLTELVTSVRARAFPREAPEATDQQLEALMTAENFEGLAFASLKGVAGYMLSRGIAGNPVATVVLADDGTEYNASGVDEFQALTAAFVQGCIDRYGNKLN